MGFNAISDREQRASSLALSGDVCVLRGVERPNDASQMRRLQAHNTHTAQLMEESHARCTCVCMRYTKSVYASKQGQVSERGKRAATRTGELERDDHALDVVRAAQEEALSSKRIGEHLHVPTVFHEAIDDLLVALERVAILVHLSFDSAKHERDSQLLRCSARSARERAPSI